MFTLAISGNSIEVLRRLDEFPVELRAAIVEKMTETVEAIYAKVHGRLPSFNIDHGVEVQGNLVIGWFEPADTKAQAREFGGKSYYWIYPSKAKLLQFIGKSGDLVYAKNVFHPPSREFRDIRDALDEEMPKFEASVEAAMAGKL